MKRRWVAFLPIAACAALFAIEVGSGQTPLPAAPAQKTTMTNMSGATPLYFIANEGQMNARALYYARTPGYTLWLTAEGLVFDLFEKTAKGEAARSFSKMMFLGANKNIEIAAADPAEYKVSYFLGRDEADWKTGISTSKAVLYKNVYDGIDLRVYGTEKQVEYDWIVAPGADPGRIRVAYSGSDQARLNADGDLVVETSTGRIIQRRPVSHQTIDGRKIAVASAFRALPDGSFGFSLGAYNPRHALTIDPLVHAYSTYLGGHNMESSTNLVVDGKGAMYVRGLTYSGDFPPEMGTQPRQDIFVTKLSPDGASLVYTAFFPAGRYFSFTKGLFVDSKGFAYVAGQTNSSKFPLKNPFQSAFGGITDGFVLKLSKDGQSLLFSSYIGGNRDDVCASVSADATGAIYIGGATRSYDFPTKRAFRSKHGGYVDAFAAKVAPGGSSLVYSTYLGGSHSDQCFEMAVDSAGSAVLVGVTSSPNFPVKSGFQKTIGGGAGDGFIAKLTPKGDGLIYSSFMGGSGSDAFYDVAVGGDGAVYVTGNTNGTFPVKNPFQVKRKGQTDAVVVKTASNGKSVVYSSYLGGGGQETAYGIAVDESGAAYVVGHTTSVNFPLKSPFRATPNGSAEAFLTIVDPAGSKLLYSTYLGGSYRELASGIALGADGAIYLVGLTNSPDIPMLPSGAYQGGWAGDDDAFVFKFTIDGAGRRK